MSPCLSGNDSLDSSPAKSELSGNLTGFTSHLMLTANSNYISLSELATGISLALEITPTFGNHIPHVI
jgi:hypothetical protein